MTKHIKAILKGMGSILDIAPEPRTQRYIPRGSDSDRLQQDFARIGRDMKRVFCSETHGRDSKS